MEEKIYPHPIRMHGGIYDVEKLDPRWHYLLQPEADEVAQRLRRLYVQQRSLRDQLQEAAAQSTENIGHDDATQETIRLQLWRMDSQIDLLRDAQLHCTLLAAPKQANRVTFGHAVHLSGSSTLKVALVGGADLPLQRRYVPEGYTAVSYRSPLGGLLLGKRLSDTFQLGKPTGSRILRFAKRNGTPDGGVQACRHAVSTLDDLYHEKRSGIAASSSAVTLTEEPRHRPTSTGPRCQTETPRQGVRGNVFKRR